MLRSRMQTRLEIIATMHHLPILRVLVSILCVSVFSSCMADRDIHGKCGDFMFSTLGPAVGLPAALLCLPATIPIVYATDAHREDALLIVYRYPAMPFYSGFYYIGTTLGYPAYLCALPFRARDFNAMSDDEKVRMLVGDMPYASRDDYEILLNASGREFAPPYAEGEFLSYDSVNKSFPYGRKACKAAYYISDEWKAWQESGAPAGGAPEKRFVVKYLTYDKQGSPDWRAMRLVCEEGGASPEEIEEFCKKAPGLSDKDKLRYWIEKHGGVDAIIQDEKR